MGKQKTKKQKMKQQLKQTASSKIPGVFKVAGAKSLKARAKAKAVAGELKKLNEEVRNQVAEVDEQLSFLQEQLFQSDTSKTEEKPSEDNSKKMSEKDTPALIKESDAAETAQKLDGMELS